MSPALRRWLPAACLILAAVAVLASGVHQELDLAGLQRHRGSLEAFVAARPLLAPLGFMLVYAVVTATMLPGAVFLTLGGGFLFGPWLGAACSVVGAGTGAVVVAAIARSAVGSSLRHRAGPWLARIEAGFRRDAFSYVLALRLIPLFPFWLVNLLPAVLAVPLPAFALATFIGIIPGALVYAGIGSGLGTILDAGGQAEPDLLLRPQIILPLLGLAALSLLPVVYRRWQDGT